LRIREERAKNLLAANAGGARANGVVDANPLLP